MIRKNVFNKLISVTLSATMLATLVLPNMKSDMFVSVAKADTLPITKLGSGSIGVGSNEAVASKLPRTNTQGVYRYTTDNYNKKHKALDTNDFASNWLWSLDGSMETYTWYDDKKDQWIVTDTDSLSGTAYPLPLAHIMKRDGLRVTKPSMTSSATNISAYNIFDNDTLVDFNIYPDWECDISNVDEISDWSYQAIATNADRSKQFKTTMTQGSPFTFIELSNSNVLNIEKMRVTFPSAIVYEGTYNGSKMIVFRTNDITSSVNGYPGLTWQYYALYLPENSTVEHMGTTDTTNNDKIGRLKITLPSDKRYASFAWLCEGQNQIDSQAISYAQEYRPYAFNFITDTKADYSYDENTSTVSTTYTYSINKKSESTADGTIMGILPHQYKNMSGYSYMGNNAVTIRGIMKFIKGSSYTTKMTYEGIIPYMPTLPESDTAGRAQLQSYVDDFVNTYMTGAGDWTLAKDEGNETYYHGKKLNRSAQVVAAAKSLGDEESAEIVLKGLQANLEEWFTYSGAEDKNYFTYLGEGVGVLLGFPTSFNAVDQFNDHHFHYGYFIQAAACVGLWDKEWLNEYKEVVKQLVYDIASPYRNQEDCVKDCGNAYPYLRSFSPYEGHSWASGYQDERTGNNQESTSEAINAWAGVILFGELIGDEEIRDLGIYLYTTEIESANNYWFDHDKDIYKIQNTKYEPPMASMVWGGKIDYSTWFGQNCTQGIQICPMQSWSFYLLDGGKDYIKEYYNYDRTSANAKNPQTGEVGSTGQWNDMWAAYYALAEPTTAMNSVWNKQAINDGESQAHTYHYIQSLIDYGTPDRSFTSNDPMTSVFEKNGKYTYAVYNSSSQTKTVTFKNASGVAVNVKAQPNGMTLFNSDDIGKLSYTVEYYGKNLNDNGYTSLGMDIKYATSGAKVTATAKEFTGYKYDSSNSNNVLSGTVNSDGTLVLKVYYQRETYSISYDLTGGSKVNASKYPSAYTYGQKYELDTPVRTGYDFYGWYADIEYDEKVSSITAKHHGNLTLYAKWIPQGTIMVNEDIYLTFDPNTNGTFTIVGDTAYDSIQVLYRFSDTESEAKELADSKAESGFVSWNMDKNDSGWTRTENFASYAGKYITFYFIRHDSVGGYKTEYGYGRVGAGSGEVETTMAPTKPSETTAPQVSEDINPSEVTNWSQVLNNSNVSYYIVGDTSKVSVKPEQHGDGIYIAYTISAAFKSVTLNGVSKTPTDGAFYTVSMNDIANSGYYTLIVTDYYGNESVKIYFKVGSSTVEPEPTIPAETTTVPTDSNEPSEVTDWTLVQGSSNIYYYICDGKADKVSVKPQQRAEDVYMAYTLAGAFSSVTLNGKAKEPWKGADYAIPLSELATAGYYTLAVVDYYGRETVTIYLKVDSSAVEPTTPAPTTTVAPTTPATTTSPEEPSEGAPIEVMGEMISSNEPGIINVVWGQDADRIESGQKYNVYIDGVIAKDINGTLLQNVACGLYNIPTSEGTHTIKITAVLNGMETNGVGGNVTVQGNAEVPTISGEIKIEGYQISTTAKGLRTIYSVDSVLEGKEVKEVGLIYGLAGDGYATVNDMYYDSDSAYVEAFKAEIGRVGDTSTYIMTMKFAQLTKSEFTAEMMVRAYAKLSDGTYAYSEVGDYSIYEVASYVYDNCKMPTVEGHSFIYEDILKIVNPDYVIKEYEWIETIVK